MTEFASFVCLYMGCLSAVDMIDSDVFAQL